MMCITSELLPNKKYNLYKVILIAMVEFCLIFEESLIHVDRV